MLDFPKVDQGMQILNITGFRKALKKFEKVTGVWLFGLVVNTSQVIALGTSAECVHEGEGLFYLSRCKDVFLKVTHRLTFVVFRQTRLCKSY